MVATSSLPGSRTSSERDFCAKYRSRGHYLLTQAITRYVGTLVRLVGAYRSQLKTGCSERIFWSFDWAKIGIGVGCGVAAILLAWFGS